VIIYSWFLLLKLHYIKQLQVWKWWMYVTPFIRFMRVIIAHKNLGV